MDSVQVMEAQLLNEMTSGVLGPINDILEIDAETRTIYVPSTELLFGVVTDADAERKYFRCPRIVGDNLDLTTFGLRVHFENAQGNRDKYIVTDVKVDGDYITFSWRLSEKVLKYSGAVNFAICAVEALADGTTKIRWNTTLTTGTVLGGLEVDDLDIEEETQSRDVLQQLLDLMDEEVSARTKEVQDECAEQIQNVKDEGSAQIKMVEEKGAATLATIPEDYTAMTETVDMLARVSGQVIRQGSEGKIITINDSAKMPMLGMKIYGKSEQFTTTGYQLFDASRLNSAEAGGVKFTNNGDGSFTIAGEGALTSNFSASYNVQHDEFVKLFRVGALHLVSTRTRPYFGITIMNGVTGDRLITMLYTSPECDITQEMLDDENIIMVFNVYGAADGEIIPGTIKPMLYQDGDGTWEPFVGGQPSPNPEYPQEIKSIENPITYVTGKNLIDVSKAVNKNLVENNGEYTLTINTVDDRFSSTVPVYIPANTQIMVSFNVLEYTKASANLPFYFTGESGKSYYGSSSGTFTRIYDEPLVSLRFYLQSTEQIGAYIKFSDFQIELGSKMTEYEPYDIDQTLESVSTLRAIPVASGGNYIDENGQQWITDYRDWERGVDVHKCKELILTGEETNLQTYNHSAYGVVHGFRLRIPDMIDISNIYYVSHIGLVSSHFRYGGYVCDQIDTGIGISEAQYIYLRFDGENDNITTIEDCKALLSAKYANGNPVKVLYILANPIETPIPTEELLAYKALHTNYPNTTIVNDSDAHMEVTYGTDTKMYIDNKFAELKAALTNNS